jgi:hypothetical protein
MRSSHGVRPDAGERVASGCTLPLPSRRRSRCDWCASRRYARPKATPASVGGPCHVRSSRPASALVTPQPSLGMRQRNRNIRAITRSSRRRWHKTSGYSGRAMVENTMAWYKAAFVSAMRARSLAGPSTHGLVVGPRLASCHECLFPCHGVCLEGYGRPHRAAAVVIHARPTWAGARLRER